MGGLYARFILWLIRPALERRAAESIDLQAAVVQAVLDDMRKNGRVARAMRGMVNPDCSVTLLNREGCSPLSGPARPGKDAPPPQRSKGPGEES